MNLPQIVSKEEWEKPKGCAAAPGRATPSFE
jgi:hypothetical protein